MNKLGGKDLIYNAAYQALGLVVSEKKLCEKFS